MGAKLMRRGVKFQGNWQYGNAILDWIRTMQALSNWHTWTTEGLGRRLRNMFLPFAKKRNPITPLPIGIPPPTTTLNRGSKSSSASTSTSTNSSSFGQPSQEQQQQQQHRITELEHQVEELNTISDIFTAILAHVNLMLNAAVYPISSSKLDDDGQSKRETTAVGTNKKRPYTDMYACMYQTKGRENENNAATDDDYYDDVDVIYTCVLETAMDYCERVRHHVTKNIMDALKKDGTWATFNFDKLEEKELGVALDCFEAEYSEEPYCTIVDECMGDGGITNGRCRPATCPFHDEIACRFLTRCLDPEWKAVYAKEK
jgi:hypothetical protein